MDTARPGSHPCRNSDRRSKVLYKACHLFQDMGSWKTRRGDSGVLLQRKQPGQRPPWIRPGTDPSRRDAGIYRSSAASSAGPETPGEIIMRTFCSILALAAACAVVAPIIAAEDKPLTLASQGSY